MIGNTFSQTTDNGVIFGYDGESVPSAGVVTGTDTAANGVASTDDTAVIDPSVGMGPTPTPTPTPTATPTPTRSAR